MNQKIQNREKDLQELKEAVASHKVRKSTCCKMKKDGKSCHDLFTLSEKKSYSLFNSTKVDATQKLFSE